MIEINIPKLNSIIIALFVFFTLNIPSIKIIYSSEIVNFMILIGLWIFGLIRILFIKNIDISKHKIIYLLIFYALWASMFLITLVKVPSALSLEEFVKYVVTILFVTGAFLFLDRTDIPKIIFFQIIWALILSLSHLLGLISLNRSLGQHYLTLGLPITAGVICAFVLFFFHKQIFTRKLFLLITMIISLIELISLKGRSPVILSVIVPLLIVILIIISEKRISKKVYITILSSVLGSFFVYFLYNNLSDDLLNRLQNLSSGIEDEPRKIIFDQSIYLIKENPIGYGLQSGQLRVSYPHNIFLEVSLSGGIIALIFLLMLTIFTGYQVVQSIKENVFSIASSAIGIAFFMTWNLSYDLTSSYIPFVSMAVIFASLENDKIGNTNRGLLYRNQTYISQKDYLQVLLTFPTLK